MKYLQRLLMVFSAAITFTADADAETQATHAKLTMEPYLFTANSGETVAAEKGRLWVPENRSNPNARSIKLEFVRFKSSNPKPGSPIIYLAGGPGGSGIATARWRRFPLFMALTEVADVIALDQRGTGASNSIPECKTKLSAPDNEAIKAEVQLERFRSAAKQCALFWQQNGVDIDGYNTRENAADLNDLRRALGAEKISLWGISYGSHLALETLKQFPSNIDRVVLASIEGSDHTIKLPARTDAYFARVQQAINLDLRAKSAYPNLVATMQSVHRKLEQQPLDIRFQDQQGKHLQFKLGKLEMQMAVSGMISDPENMTMLPAIYSALNHGAVQALPPQLLEAIYRATRSNIVFSGMAEAMDAASGISATRKKMVNEQAKTSLLGHALNPPYHLIRDELGVKDLGRSFREPTQSDVPTLFLSGTLDGRTYPESAAEVARGFKNGTHVSIKNAGHNLFMQSPEIVNLVVSFMGGKTVKSAEIVLPAPKFPVFN